VLSLPRSMARVSRLARLSVGVSRSTNQNRSLDSQSSGSAGGFGYCSGFTEGLVSGSSPSSFGIFVWPCGSMGSICTGVQWGLVPMSIYVVFAQIVRFKERQTHCSRCRWGTLPPFGRGGSSHPRISAVLSRNRPQPTMVAGGAVLQ
jgi:hypothetical protein